jgi:flagellar biosynthetic protein FliO
MFGKRRLAVLVFYIIMAGVLLSPFGGGFRADENGPENGGYPSGYETVGDATSPTPEPSPEATPRPPLSIGGDMSFPSFGSILWPLFAFVMILTAAYFATKYMSRMQFFKRATANLRVLEATSVAPNSTIQIVRVGSRAFLLGVTRDRITFLAELNDEDLSAGTRLSDEQEQSFKTPVPLEKYLSIFKRNKSEKQDNEGD